MTNRFPWALAAALPLALVTGCVSVTNGDGDQVQVTVQARYQKRPPSTGSLTTLPARYALAELRNASNDALVAGPVGLDANGAGALTVPRNANVYAVVYADVMAPTANGSSFILYGNVKKGLPAASYATAAAFDQDTGAPVWYSTSNSFTAGSDGTVAVTALEATSEAGAFAIADQMVTFAQGMAAVEPGLPLPDLHVFWGSGTQGAYPSAVTDASGNLLVRSSTKRPLLSQQLWYGGPSNCADAFNDSLIQENFAHGLFAYGSYWTVNGSNQYSFGTILRGDADPAIISPWIASESTIAFQNGFGYFLSSAFRNDPNQYFVASDGAVSSWQLNQHTSPAPVGGGEFYGASIARSLWGIWKNDFSGSTAGLQALWNATVPSLANQPYEYGNAPLACYPTYLVGLKRLNPAVAAVIDSELSLENVGNGLTSTSAVYFNSSALWATITPSSSALVGSLTTYDNNQAQYADAYYDRAQSQAYRFTHAGGNLTVSLSTSAPGLLLEVFDNQGFLAYRKATPSINGIYGPVSLPAGTYAVRVRLDPGYKFNGNPASYSLIIN